MNFWGSYENLYESNNNLNIKEENVMLPQTNQKKVPDLLSKYAKIFAKSKYETKKIKMEP